ncbi:Uncharacterised protein [Sphingobacterium multivorum]|uniref:Thiol-disulfide oxidoreductase n=2 Tax=Sphingobacterium multivorum TaxID=28454 RepID=A0A653XIT0_SPHMU|nr:Uncharacterised protein [Sphingobacterium multivorum]VXC29999.1 conserved membrane hypothetical protein [Sphingobacterium multivorum]
MKLFYSYMERLCVYIIHYISLCLSITPAILRHKLVYVRQVFLLPVFCFIMFSNARAQSAGERTDARVDTEIKLSIGSGLPDDFWSRKHLFFSGGDTVSRDLSMYKGKLLILDFWYIGCSSCLLDQAAITKAKERYKDRIHVVMVNNLPKWNDIGAFRKFYSDKKYIQFGMDEFESIIYDDYLYNLFGASAYPLYVWISSSGIVKIMTNMNLLDESFSIPSEERRDHL